jgi:hypothetical protein
MTISYFTNESRDNQYLIVVYTQIFNLNIITTTMENHTKITYCLKNMAEWPHLTSFMPKRQKIAQSNGTSCHQLAFLYIVMGHGPILHRKRAAGVEVEDIANF